MRLDRERLDSANPRTWLLAAVAGWALLVLLLALFGMGGRIAPLPEDPALLRPLPALPTPARPRLGPLAQYGEIAARPLFADDRRPRPFSLRPEAGEQPAKAFDYVLTSVMITPSFQMAIIQSPDGNAAPLRIRVGEGHESLPNWRLQSLDARSAVFVGPEGERQLQLRVYNGVGGQAPTATAPRGRPVQGAIQGPIRPPPDETADAASQAANQTAESTAPVQPPAEAPPSTPMTEQAQMDAIRKRIEARRAQLRQQALQEQQRQNQTPPVK